MVLNMDLRLFYSTLNFLLFKQTVQTLIRHCIQRHLIWVCTFCHCPSPGFTDNPYTVLCRRSDKNTKQGPVVQSVVSLTSSLRVISLTVLADSIYNILIFFAEKMRVDFALQKLLTFFSAKIFSIFVCHSM